MELQEKYENLISYFKKCQSVAVAFSGGVDSTFLLKVAQKVLQKNVIAITVKSCFFPQKEFEETIDFCESEGIRQQIIEINPLAIEEIENNSTNRCYSCKKKMFQELLEIARKNGIEKVVEGSNMDDFGDYRPGMQAIKELEIDSPLQCAKLYKSEIRDLSKDYELATWKKPSLACLATRIPYGEMITEEKLIMVDKAEQFLNQLGFDKVRVRIQGKTARIEVEPKELRRVIDCREEIIIKFKEYGFVYISLDLMGYRSGSMNEALSTLH